MRMSGVLALTLAALGAGLSVGYVLGSPRPGDLVPRADFDAAARERDEARAESDRRGRELAALQRRRAEGNGATVVSGPAETAPDAGAAEPPKPAPDRPADTTSDIPTDPALRRARIDEIARTIDEHFAEGDGEAALKALRDLADLAPEGRDAAMALAVRINDDVRGASELGLDVYRFYQHLGDTGIRDLMQWSLAGNPSPPGFRTMAAFSLPWVLPRDKAIEVLTASLRPEKDVNVQLAIVGNLTQMNDRRSDAALAAIFADRERDPLLRAQIATAIALAEDPATVRALEGAAQDDADERVRAASRAALTARNPPADGYLVTWVVPDGQAAAAGVRTGDILLRYDGVAIGNLQELQTRIRASAGREQVEVAWFHDGREVVASCRGGSLGVQGRPVRKK